jgi:Nitrile hydratase beta subunit
LQSERTSTRCARYFFQAAADARHPPAGNPRTPAYVRGKGGTVTVLHGSIVNPLDHRGVYPPLCSVLFLVGEVFGGASRDTLSVDLHEDWLD